MVYLSMLYIIVSVYHVYGFQMSINTTTLMQCQMTTHVQTRRKPHPQHSRQHLPSSGSVTVVYVVVGLAPKIGYTMECCVLGQTIFIGCSKQT